MGLLYKGLEPNQRSQQSGPRTQAVSPGLNGGRSPQFPKTADAAALSRCGGCWRPPRQEPGLAEPLQQQHDTAVSNRQAQKTQQAAGSAAQWHSCQKPCWLAQMLSSGASP